MGFNVCLSCWWKILIEANDGILKSWMHRLCGGCKHTSLCRVSVFRDPDQNRRPREIQKCPYWPTPCLVLVIFPGTRTPSQLTQIQYTYAFICFMATIQSEPLKKPLKKPLKTKVNTRGLRRTVCLLTHAQGSWKTWTEWTFCLFMLRVEHIVRVGMPLDKHITYAR